MMRTSLVRNIETLPAYRVNKQTVYNKQPIIIAAKTGRHTGVTVQPAASITMANLGLLDALQNASAQSYSVEADR